jgi:alanine racemase
VTAFRPTVVEIDLDAVRHNVRALKPDSAEVMAVVKADGYGHGAAQVARAAVDTGATWLGVALVEEGLELRAAGLSAPIMVLSEFAPGSERDALEANLTPVLYTDEGLAALAAAARKLGRSVAVHVKLDTGMHRVGLPPERAAEFAGALAGAGLELEGLWTHFAMADTPGHPFVTTQLERFLQASARLESAGFIPRYRHAASSGTILARSDAHLDLVRLGISLYGLLPGPELDGLAEIRPALTWRTEVAMAKRVAGGEAISYGLRYRLERPSTIATIPVGYADGYRRGLTGRGQVLIRGRRRPIAGTVCMDQVMVDCGDDPVEAGDEVVLIGRQGDQDISADEVAGWLDTISYEVVCGISRRVPREYVGA